jgi:hypothetical protein
MSLTVQQARELLGDEAVGMTDAQVEDTITALDSIADMVIDCYIERGKGVARQGDEDAA